MLVKYLIISGNEDFRRASNSYFWTMFRTMMWVIIGFKGWHFSPSSKERKALSKKLFVFETLLATPILERRSAWGSFPNGPCSRSYTSRYEMKYIRDVRCGPTLFSIIALSKSNNQRLGMTDDVLRDSELFWSTELPQIWPWISWLGTKSSGNSGHHVNQWENGKRAKDSSKRPWRTYDVILFFLLFAGVFSNVYYFHELLRTNANCLSFVLTVLD